MHVFPKKYIYNEESKVQRVKCTETISRNMLYALFVILRTLLPLNVIHLMITNLLLIPARAQISKAKKNSCRQNTHLPKNVML